MHYDNLPLAIYLLKESVMPELPEVETVRRGLAPAFEGARIDKVDLRRPDLRFPFPENFAARLTGRTVAALTRRAKYLLGDLDDGEVLVMHLGMSGSFQVEGGDASRCYFDRSKDAKHNHVAFYLSNGATITYNDPRRFGFMDLIPRASLAQHKLFSNIGIEPLGNELDGERLQGLFAGKAAPLKAALLDQSLISGLGNIYVCEAMFRSRLSPLRKAGSLNAAEAETLAANIRIILEEAIAAGGSTLNDFQHTDGALGYFQHHFQVYDREDAPCPNCGSPIKRMVQSGRSTFYCATCQR
jgi:formamidopyrimidine-DNA glycosylase